MTLRTAHIILIGAAITLGGLLLLYGISRYVAHRDTAALAVGVAGCVVGALLGLYLRHFLRKRPRAR